MHPNKHGPIPALLLLALLAACTAAPQPPTPTASATPPPTPPTTPALEAGPDFSVRYLDLTDCGGQYALRFRLTNTGPLKWASVRIDIADMLTASTFTHRHDGFKDYDGCPPKSQQSELAPGESVDVTAANLGQLTYDPSGHRLQVTVELCSEPQQAGTCVAQNLELVP